jgi:hypothetical protein
MGGAYSTYGGEEKLISGFGRDAWGKAATWKSQAQMGEQY